MKQTKEKLLKQGIIFITLSVVILWSSFYIGGELQIREELQHWYDVPYVLTVASLWAGVVTKGIACFFSSLDK